jgi:hypothetical protein
MEKPPKKIDDKENLRRLVAQGAVEEAIQHLLSVTQSNPTGGLHKQAILLSSKQEQYERDQRLGTQDYDDLARTRINIEKALLDLGDELPDQTAGGDGQKTAKPKRPRGIRERTLKSHILWIMLVVKIIVILYLVTQWEAGGFTNDQFIGTLSLLVPVFATYTGLMFKDSVQHRYADAIIVKEPRVSRRFQWTAYLVLAAYLIALIVVIRLHPLGILSSGETDTAYYSNSESYQRMTGLLALVESALGVYVGQIVFALFKKEDS